MSYVWQNLLGLLRIRPSFFESFAARRSVRATKVAHLVIEVILWRLWNTKANLCGFEIFLLTIPTIKINYQRMINKHLLCSWVWAAPHSMNPLQLITVVSQRIPVIVNCSLNKHRRRIHDGSNIQNIQCAVAEAVEEPDLKLTMWNIQQGSRFVHFQIFQWMKMLQSIFKTGSETIGSTTSPTSNWQ